MKYKKIRDCKAIGGTKFPYREIHINKDEIPEITLTGDEYINIKTSKGRLLIDAKHGARLSITFFNIKTKAVEIAKSKDVEIKSSDF